MSGMNWRNPGTASSRALASSSANWGVPGNIVFSDGICCVAALNTGSGKYTNYLTAQNFNFNIPSTATILGVYVKIGQCGQSTNIAKDYSVVLIRADNTVGSTNKATATTYPIWANPNAYQYYGGSTDLWGETLSPSDVNNANFGVAFSAQETVCFVKGTKIDTPKGIVSIEKLKIGDYVISFDKKEHTNVSKVTGIIKNKVKEVICLNGNVTATPEHPFRTTKGFKKLKDLKIGDFLLTLCGWSRVNSLETKSGNYWVYNLSVSGDETYYANGYGVHNKPSGNTVGCDHIAMIIYFSDKNLRISGQ